MVGVNSIDDLTKTRASLDFTRTPDVVFDGRNFATDCWGHHSIQPPFYWYMDECNVNAFDSDGPSSVFIQLKGEYHHSVVPVLLDHWTTAKAEGTVTHDKATCAVHDLPSGSSLECELDSGAAD